MSSPPDRQHNDSNGPGARSAAERRELTPRALISGLLLGAALTPANIYSGLKIGFTFNMSIIALLASFSFWRGLALAPR